MKKQLLAAALLLVASVAPMRADIFEQVLVKVNGDIITKTELEQRQVAVLRQKMQGQIDPASLKNWGSASVMTSSSRSSRTSARSRSSRTKQSSRPLSRRKT